MISLTKKLKYVYLTWATFTFVVTFMKKGWDVNNLTHAGILLFFFTTFLLQAHKPVVGSEKKRKWFFIGKCVLFAAVGEGCYMISKPLLPTLLITAGMPLSHMIRNYTVDVLMTTPAYVVIFLVEWWLINKYHYGPWEFIFLFGLGQALGDGNSALLAAPALLLFIPYIMINYHAMNVVAYWQIKDQLPANRSQSRWRLVLPLVILPLTYFLCGSIIMTGAKLLKI